MPIEITDPAGREIQARITALREKIAAKEAAGAMPAEQRRNFARMLDAEETALVQHLLGRRQIAAAQILETL